MASLEKYTSGQVLFEMRHNTREHDKPPRNVDIDASRTPLNFSLAPVDRGGAQPNGGKAAKAARTYHRARLKEVYHYNRDDVITACQWVVTKPKDLPPDETDAFWRETVAFLNYTYGAENCIQCVVHYDEGLRMNGQHIAGEPHLHYMFLPVLRNKKYLQPDKRGIISRARSFKYKICADELITKKHLREFHPKYQKWLNNHGIHCTVHSGVTGGQNRTVDELKRATIEKELAWAQERIQELTVENETRRVHAENLTQTHDQALSEMRTMVAELMAENKILQNHIATIERERDQARQQVQEYERSREKTITTGWGDTSGWGSGREIEWGSKNL